MRPELEDLNIQQRMFVMEYIKDFRPTKAAERIGLSGSTGSKYMSDPLVSEAIAVAMEERAVRTEVDADWVLKELYLMFTADLADIFYPGTDTLRPVHEWPAVWRKMVNGIKVSEIREQGAVVGHIKDIKIIDRMRAIENIGKHVDVKAFTERVEIATDQALTEKLLRGRKRARERNAPDEPEEMSFL